MPKGSDIFVAKETFHTVLDGVPVTIHEGERVREGHALLKNSEDRFEQLNYDVDYDVEKATAAPGEKRGSSSSESSRS